MQYLSEQVLAKVLEFKKMQELIKELAFLSVVVYN